MNLKLFLKSSAFFFAIIFFLFGGILFALNSRHATFPAPLPNQYPQALMTPEKAP
jgi:hypothetical protein